MRTELGKGEPAHLAEESSTLPRHETLTSRDEVSAQLRIVLDDATGRWGIRVNRVELKPIDPPVTIREAMEKQMRAERDRRGAILTADRESSRPSSGTGSAGVGDSRGRGSQDDQERCSRRFTEAMSTRS